MRMENKGSNEPVIVTCDDCGHVRVCRFLEYFTEGAEDCPWFLEV